VFKIFPNHVFNWAVLLILFGAVSGLAIDKGQAALNLTLIQSWFPKYTTIFSVNPMAWSLSCEALFYLSFPLLARLILRIRPERLWAWAGGVAAAIFAVPAIATALPHTQLVPGMPLQMWFTYIFPPARMLEFTFGIILARIVITGRRLPLSLGGATALAAAAYFIEAQLPVSITYVAVMVIPLGLVIAAAAARDTARQRTLVSGRVMVWLGEISFAFYLWHFAVLAYGHQWLGGPAVLSTGAATARLFLYFVVALAISAAVYTCVERPVYRRFATSRRGRARAAVLPVPAAASASASAEDGDLAA
jgi:mycarose O-acyltransferase